MGTNYPKDVNLNIVLLVYGSGSIDTRTARNETSKSGGMGMAQDARIQDGVL